MQKQKATGQTAKHAGTAKHAAAKKHTAAKKHKPSKAQAAAAAKWQQAGAKAAHKAAVARHAQHPKAKPMHWSPGWDASCCAAEALAASLRLTGATVTDEDVLALYWRTADHPEAGATLSATLQAAAEYGLAGVRPIDARPAAALDAGVVLGLDLAQPHAVVLDGPGVWTWSEWRPVSPAFVAEVLLEAWEVSWP